MSAPLIGIDLGTTHSLCSVFREGRPELIPNATGHRLTPSVVGVIDDQIVVGAAAVELRVTRPERTASMFKRWMGTDREIPLGERTFSAPELSSLVLRSLKRDAEVTLGTEVRRAVITVPAYFNDHQRKATKLAGELAGLEVQRIINEPTAAALTYGFHDRATDKRFLVFDLGGGTFDVTLMEVFEGTLEIIATSGESQLGGEDFTDRLAAFVLKQHGLSFEQVEFRELARLSRLRAECERAKRALSGEGHPSSTVRLPGPDGRLDPSSPTIAIDLEIVAAQTSDLLERLERPVFRALADAEWNASDLDEVILVGGATRLPLVADLVRRRLGVDPLCRFDPDHVVALGAAVQAALIADDRSVDDMVMTDVCPFTLGVETTKQLGTRFRDGYYLPVIHRNTTIPVSREEVVGTLVENQSEMRLRVFQGEGRRVQDNLLLGELQVTGIPPGPIGTEVHVRFTYDLNGILEVEALIPTTGRRFHTVLLQHVKGLSESEIRRAVSKLQELKFYPRDELRNQRLLRFAERAVGEINPFQREELDHAVDQFERAMAQSDRGRFEESRESLLVTLSRLGFDFDDGPVDDASDGVAADDSE
ncbi:MAG: Hsp70 family protein [Planctomycetes bacterium]|nr:Hsp70 family protein [Planctomycetota bacterium]